MKKMSLRLCGWNYVVILLGLVRKSHGQSNSKHGLQSLVISCCQRERPSVRVERCLRLDDAFHLLVSLIVVSINLKVPCVKYCGRTLVTLQLAFLAFTRVQRTTEKAD